MTAAPTAEIAIGRKIRDLATGSQRPMRSTNTAMTNPIETTKPVTKISHRTLLRKASSMSGLVSAKV